MRERGATDSNKFSGNIATEVGQNPVLGMNAAGYKVSLA